MAMENVPIEDVSPIENGDVPLPCYFTGGYLVLDLICLPTINL